MFTVNNRNTRKKCEICSKLTIKTERRQWRRSGVFIVNFEHISHLFPVLLLLPWASKWLHDSLRVNAFLYFNAVLNLELMPLESIEIRKQLFTDAPQDKCPWNFHSIRRPQVCNCIKKQNVVQVFYSEFFEIFRTPFYRTPPAAASGNKLSLVRNGSTDRTCKHTYFNEV